MYLYVCISTCLCTYYLYVIFKMFIRGPGINWSWKLGNTCCDSWDPSSGLLKEKQKLLTAESSFCLAKFVFILFYIYLKTKALQTKLEIIPGINNFLLEMHHSVFFNKKSYAKCFNLKLEYKMYMSKILFLGFKSLFLSTRLGAMATLQRKPWYKKIEKAILRGWGIKSPMAKQKRFQRHD